MPSKDQQQMEMRRSILINNSTDYEYDLPKKPSTKSIFSVNNGQSLGNPRVKLAARPLKNAAQQPSYARPGGSNEYIYEELGDDRDT